MIKLFDFIRRVFTSSKFPRNKENSEKEGENYNVKTLDNGSGDRKVVLLDPGNSSEN